MRNTDGEEEERERERQKSRMCAHGVKGVQAESSEKRQRPSEGRSVLICGRKKRINTTKY